MSHGRPIDDLELIDWDRDVVIVPDSDVFERSDLLRAIYALGRELRERGAVVTVAVIPQEEKKVGLDDYLFSGGVVDDLDTVGLGSRVWRGAQSWFGPWKLKSLEAA